MAFVNEAISEQDKQKYKITEFPSYPQRHWKDWTIDRERNCFLLRDGMSHDRPFQYFFILFYNGSVAEITVNVEGNGKSQEGVNLTNYNITHIGDRSGFRLPDLESKKDEIVRIFSEAISAHEDKKFLNRKVTVLYLGKKLEVK